MCGICGFVHNREIDEKVLVKMNDTLVHRGPDDSGHIVRSIGNYQVGMAHRRLAILDLSSAGHQPMALDDNSVIVSYNGEIYNFQSIKDELIRLGYTFVSNCDTEVILKAYREWGLECIQRFNGMFAIALWDENKKEFYLIRDRMGVKPLYYYVFDNNIAFASELKALMEYPFFDKTINHNALALLVERRYITGPESIFLNTYKLEPGHLLKWDGMGIRIECYWNFQKKYNDLSRFEGSYEEAADELRELIRDSVRLRMISDVPVGGFLSGGYDSSLITAVMKEQCNGPINTFTIGFEEDRYNEAPYAEKIARHLGTNHCCEYLPVSKAKKMIDEIPIYFDEPMADESLIATMLLSKITKEKVTVALSGDAGDELFCGYSEYSYFDLYKKYLPVSKLLQTIDKLIPVRRHLPRKVNKVYYLDTPEHIVASSHLVFRDRYSELLGRVGQSEKYDSLTQYSENAIEAYMLRDINTSLPDDIMAKVDRAAMSVSLETRAPLLDYRIVEFALSLPLEYKYFNGEKKRLLKKLAYEYIPPALLDRPKQGFAVPVREWLAEDFDNFTRGCFEDAFLKRQGIFSVQEIKKLKHGLIEKKDMGMGNILWNLFVFQMWWSRWVA